MKIWVALVILVSAVFLANYRQRNEVQNLTSLCSQPHEAKPPQVTADGNRTEDSKPAALQPTTSSVGDGKDDSSGFRNARELKIARGRTNLFQRNGTINQAVLNDLGLSVEESKKVVSSFGQYTIEAKSRELATMLIRQDGDNEEIVVPKLSFEDLKQKLRAEMEADGITGEAVNVLMSALQYSNRYTEDVYPLSVSYLEKGQGLYHLLITHPKRSGMLPSDKNYTGNDYRMVNVSIEYAADTTDGYGSFKHILDNVAKLRQQLPTPKNEDMQKK